MNSPVMLTLVWYGAMSPRWNPLPDFEECVLRCECLERSRSLW